MCAVVFGDVLVLRSQYWTSEARVDVRGGGGGGGTLPVAVCGIGVAEWTRKERRNDSRMSKCGGE